jgi:hypothetical protein
MSVVEPLSLDDEELRIVRDCAATLPPRFRSTFLVDFAREMKAYPVHGAGLVARVARAVARRHLNAAANAASGSAGMSASSRVRARLSAEALFRPVS